VNGSSVDANTSGEIQALPVDTSDSDIGQQIRALLLEDGTLSARALAAQIGCSPTTASKWKSRIEAER
jgi:predicted ArsR family transcriptional regulator